ncbi:dienelactone hydrolase family protein [Microvirga guangxiensis]|uniref:Alpha/beta hydrolase family protein n=1 Tax=Microvirga guangxiensis TaxID=549386 RepID=A0A1G5LFA7_9HYPH|nr:alpha/beta hydrolase [Microvirga guangxiensis]SCZ11605.1 Alpha/beta hydrolase family protein [Microvirga guangxiensis]
MRRSLYAFVLLGSCLAAPMAFAATPPKQPEKGPGGGDYKITEVIKTGVGTVSSGSYVFYGNDTPAGPRPVVVFFHSWGAVNPALYGGFIDHLARKGYLVLFPRFQEVNRSRPADAPERADNLIREALAQLGSDQNARPDLTRVAYIGHSAGVPLALNVAAKAEGPAMPAPKLVFGFMPGGIASSEKERGIMLRDLSTVDPSTLIVMMSGDREHLPSDRASRRLFSETSGVPISRKLFMRASSDDHGYPPLTATLASPGSPKPDYDASVIKLQPDPPRDPKQRNTWKWSADMALSGPQTILTQQIGNNGTDTLDYLAYWRTFEMAAEAAFAGKDASALQRDPKFIDMGNWSDGWPVRRLSAQTPKVEGQEKPEEQGPRRRLNMAPPETKEGGLNGFIRQLRS